MKYSHAVKLNGVYYAPNTEIPEELPKVEAEPKKVTETKDKSETKKAVKGDK